MPSRRGAHAARLRRATLYFRDERCAPSHCGGRRLVGAPLHLFDARVVEQRRRLRWSGFRVHRARRRGDAHDAPERRAVLDDVVSEKVVGRERTAFAPRRSVAHRPVVACRVAEAFVRRDGGRPPRLPIGVRAAGRRRRADCDRVGRLAPRPAGRGRAARRRRQMGSCSCGAGGLLASQSGALDLGRGIVAA